MHGSRLQECLKIIRWSDDTLADALGCDVEWVQAWTLGFEDIPPKVAAWVETLALAHQALEAEKPKSMRGKVFKGL